MGSSVLATIPPRTHSPLLTPLYSRTLAQPCLTELIYSLEVFLPGYEQRWDT